MSAPLLHFVDGDFDIITIEGDESDRKYDGYFIITASRGPAGMAAVLTELRSHAPVDSPLWYFRPDKLVEVIHLSKVAMGNICDILWYNENPDPLLGKMYKSVKC